MRCVKSGLVCSGPVLAMTTFIHTNQSNIQDQSHREALFAAMKDRRRRTESEGPPPSAGTERVPHWSAPLDYIPLELRPLSSGAFPSLGPGNSFYAALLHEFEPRGKFGIFGADRTDHPHALYSCFAICTRSLLPLASWSNRTVLDCSIFSLLTAYVGHMRKESKLVDLASGSYTRAIGQFRSQIASLTDESDLASRQSVYQKLTCLAMAFQLFEASLLSIP